MYVASKNSAIVLFSGGLDSTTTLAIADKNSSDLIALTLNYSQKHHYEIEASKKIIKKYKNVCHVIFDVDLAKIGGSALTDDSIKVPESETTKGIPITYVPARNTIFLSIAAAYAEKNNIKDIYIGVNSIDYSGYPDCREEFIKSFEETINLGTKRGVEGKSIKIHTPLIHLKKSEIISEGIKLDVDYSLTLSCYQPSYSGEACGKCDSCHYRKEGFRDANISDPTIYKK
tara:strand:+ start:340 stop:1029 length:690 start_codon:yes stop_codon:yes gene_type:complete